MALQQGKVMMKFLLYFVSVTVTVASTSNLQSPIWQPQNVDNQSCHPWTTVTNNASCTCPVESSRNKVVKCSNNGSFVTLPFCYCMSYNEQLNLTVVGYCVFRCHVYIFDPLRKHTVEDQESYRYEVIAGNASNFSELNRYFCSDLQLNRTGQMCGSCIDGFSPPVYSYSFACANCTSDYEYNWLKYIIIAYLPVTVFYMFIIIFRMSAMSGRVSGYILSIQIASAPAILRLVSVVAVSKFANKGDTGRLLLELIISFWSVFNLDFFRSLYTPFCIHPKFSTLDTLALDYAIALYPLLLIFVTYVCVKCHDHFIVCVKLWWPFYKCFIKLRREWEIHASLVEVFDTFILLSYVKILNTSLDLLTPLMLFSNEEKFVHQYYLKVDGSVEYFGRKHLPYAMLALVMTFSFNIVPMVLLFLYPCKTFHKCLNYFKLRRQRLHMFVEVFQGCFKTHPRDYRCFAAVYLLIRIVNLILLTVLNGFMYLPIGGMLMLLSALVIGIVKPHKSNLHSITDSVLFACLGCAFIAGYLLRFAQVLLEFYYYKVILRVISVSGASVVFLFGIGLVFCAIAPQRLLNALHTLQVKVYNCVKSKVQEENEESQPYPFKLGAEYEPLLTPVVVNLPN